MTGVSGPRCSSSASFTSDSTNGLSHCATSSRPASSARRCRARRRRARRRPSGRRRGAPTRGRRTTGPATSSTSTGGVGAQQRDRALGDHRAPGHRVHDLAVLVRGGDQRVDDLARTRTRGRGGVVDVVERRERHASAARSSTAGWRSVRANRRGAAVERGARRRQEVVGAGRTEAHDDDPVRAPCPLLAAGWAGPGSRSAGTRRTVGFQQPVLRVDLHAALRGPRGVSEGVDALGRQSSPRAMV